MVSNSLDKFDSNFGDFRLRGFIFQAFALHFIMAFPKLSRHQSKPPCWCVVCRVSLLKTNLLNPQWELTHENKCSSPGWVNVPKERYSLRSRSSRKTASSLQVTFFFFPASNPLEALVALICHSEKVPWSVKWPVDDLCCRAAAGNCCPRGWGGGGRRKSKRFLAVRLHLHFACLPVCHLTHLRKIVACWFFF